MSVATATPPAGTTAYEPVSHTIDHHPLPDLGGGRLLAELPLDGAAEEGLFDRQVDCAANDRHFAAWDAPLVWHHQKSQLRISRKFRGRRALHFAFEERVPKDVWDKSWNLWYDHAFVLRERQPGDVLITGTVAVEEVATGLGADNVDHQRPWVGLVARMQDLRRYYFLAFEYPGRVVLYRREDHQWHEIASAQVHLDVWTPYRLTLRCHGSTFRAWCNDRYLFTATDYAFAEGGFCGVRATCTAFVTDFSIRALEVPAAARRPAPTCAPLPAPTVVREFDLAELGTLAISPRHHANLSLGAIASASGEPQLLVRLHQPTDETALAAASAAAGHKVKTADPGDGRTHALVDLHGRTLWTGAFPRADLVHVLPPAADGHCDLVAVGSELYRIDGRTGAITARAPLPLAPDGRRVNGGNGPRALADLDGDGVVDTFFLTCGCNDPHLWAVDFDLRIRWYLRTPGGQGHGGHLTVCDVDGDGRDEISAGLALVSLEGCIRWTQDELARRLRCPNGHHIDQTEFGHFDGPDAPATIHCQSSSAGHLVLDALTGAMIAVHPQGHVQTGNAARIVPGLEGMQVISSNRWGSYGLTAVYDGQGRRLARFQPGFTCQYAHGLNWTGAGYEHLLVCDGQGYRGIYNHLGERLIDLDPLVPYGDADAHAQRFDRVNTIRGPFLGGLCDDLLIRIGTRIRLVSADRPAERGAPVYCPLRRGNASFPRWLRAGDAAPRDSAASFD